MNCSNDCSDNLENVKVVEVSDSEMFYTCKGDSKSKILNESNQSQHFMSDILISAVQNQDFTQETIIIGSESVEQLDINSNTNINNDTERNLDLIEKGEKEILLIDSKFNRINWICSPKMVCKAENVYTRSPNNFLKGCLWSPDGTCILSNSNDNILRIFELPKDAYQSQDNLQLNTDMVPVLQMRDLDLIYDMCWYPFMNSNNPDTCFLASTSRKNAIILWDAYTGKERARIQPRDHMDEPVSAQSLAFSRDGIKLYAGFDKCVRVYDITRLGDNPIRRPRIGNKSDLRGIISCISTSPVDTGMYACGSYSKDAAIFHENTGEQIMEFLRADDRIGGITHIEFSPVDQFCVVTGSRIDNALHIWDLRNTGSPLYATAKRNVKTNQRIYFSFDPTGNYVMTGNHDGRVSLFTVRGGHIVVDDECILPTIAEWPAHQDVCNGLSLHPFLPLLATCSGQRRMVPAWRRKGMLCGDSGGCGDSESDWSTDEDNDVIFGIDENQLRVWEFPVITDINNRTVSL